MLPERRTPKRLEALVVVLLAAPLAGGQAPAEGGVDFSTLENPVPFSEASIARGRIHYRHRCVECHGPEGKGQMDVIADATDLTDPDLWWNGTEEWQVFRSIREGAGETMPPYKFYFPDDRDIWDMVNFVISLWPEERRPPLVEEAGEGETTEKEKEKQEGRTGTNEGGSSR